MAKKINSHDLHGAHKKFIAATCEICQKHSTIFKYSHKCVGNNNNNKQLVGVVRQSKVPTASTQMPIVCYQK